MRVRVVKGFNSIVTLPGINAETAFINIDGVDTDLAVHDGAIRFAADTFNSVDFGAGTVYYVMIVNGDLNIGVDVIANPDRPNRR